MDHVIEQEICFSHATVQRATIRWQGIEESPPGNDYCLSQRLSQNHSALRIGNLDTDAVLPRVHSVGLLPPCQSVRMLPIDAPLNALYCRFHAEYFEEKSGISRQQWHQLTPSLVAITNKRLEILMQDIHAELEQPGHHHELLIESVINLILVELTRYAQELIRKANNNEDKRLALAPWQLKKIEERIQHSLQLGYPNLSELAELCGISQGHLMRSFKAATGWQIQKYIAEQRIRTAKSMLTDASASCEQVAQLLGFKSPAYFSTTFRKLTGKTPSQFRRQAMANSTGKHH